MMNNSNSGYQEVGEGGPGRTPPQPVTPDMGQYKFSPEEMRVLQECNRESFFQRSLPFGAVLGLGTGAAVQQGYFKPNPRFGAFPKVTLAVIVGYFLGKLSYQRACAEKLIALPGSYIGQLLRDRRDGKIGSASMSRDSVLPGSMLGATQGDIYSDAGPGSALDLDSNRPVFSEDLTRPENSEAIAGTESLPSRPSLSYEELRKQNRGAYAEAKQDPYRLDPNTMPSVRRPAAAPRAGAPSTNQYGDTIE